MWRIAGAAITREDDVVICRQRARQIAALLGFDAHDQSRIATAVSEVARNAFGYAGSGRIEFSVASAGSAQELVVEVRDSGPGMADADAVLDGRGRPDGRGLGLVGARRLMDGLALTSQPGEGTTVTLRKRLPRNAKPVTRARVAALAETLDEAAAPDPLAEVQRQNRELLETLETAQRRQEELERLGSELDETNRGVVALYAELEQKAEELRRASEMKSRFLSNLGHELRTPLNSILALSRMLKDRLDGPLTGEQERQVDYIHAAAGTLSDLINDLLDLAKVEAGKVEVQVGTFRIQELFATLRGVLRPLRADDAVELVFADASALPPVVSDEGKVAQILRNFISNALKYTVRGEVRVSAWVEGDRAHFAVRDTGIGIPADYLGKIFEEFEQVPNELQRRVKGTGLGLPLSRGLADLLGGAVRVESVPGEGSTFFLALPLQIRPGSRRRVLVVDDEETSRYILRQLLAGLACDVTEAADGAEGIRRARTEQPQLIILDLNMPQTDGYTVLDDLALDEATAAIPVIVATSAAIGPEQRGRLARAHAVLSKRELSRDVMAKLLEQTTP